MFKIGDIVEINTEKTRRSYCSEDSPALNLEGTIVRIKDVQHDSFSRQNIYKLELIQLKAKKPALFEENQLNMFWRDYHLVRVEDGPELDTSSLFEGE